MACTQIPYAMEQGIFWRNRELFSPNREFEHSNLRPNFDQMIKRAVIRARDGRRDAGQAATGPRHLHDNPRWAPLIAPITIKRSGRHAARLRHDGITAHVFYRFNFGHTGIEKPKRLGSNHEQVDFHARGYAALIVFLVKPTMLVAPKRERLKFGVDAPL